MSVQVYDQVQSWQEYSAGPVLPVIRADGDSGDDDGPPKSKTNKSVPADDTAGTTTNTAEG